MSFLPDKTQSTPSRSDNNHNNPIPRDANINTNPKDTHTSTSASTSASKPSKDSNSNPQPNSKDQKPNPKNLQLCRVISEAKYTARSNRYNHTRNKPQPWVIRKLMVGVTLGIMGYTGFVWIARIFIRGGEGQGGGVVNREVGNGGRIVMLVVFCVLYAWMVWGYVVVVITPPGFARDYVPKTTQPVLPRREVPLGYDYTGTGGIPDSELGHSMSIGPSDDVHIRMRDFDDHDNDNDHDLDMESIGGPSYEDQITSGNSRTRSRTSFSFSDVHPHHLQVNHPRSIRNNSHTNSHSHSHSHSHSQSHAQSHPPSSSRSRTQSVSNTVPRSRSQSQSQPYAQPHTQPYHPHVQAQTQAGTTVGMEAGVLSAFPNPIPNAVKAGVAGVAEPERASQAQAQPPFQPNPKPNTNSKNTKFSQRESALLKRDLLVISLRSPHNITRHPPLTPVLDPSHRYCVRDEIVKPYRAHHCRVCGTCVLKYDHHCPWIGQCVGGKNHKYFLNFNLATSFFTAYTFATVLPFTIRDAQGTGAGLDVHRIVILALSFLFFIFTFLLFLTHMRLLMLHQTTVESLQHRSMEERDDRVLGDVFGAGCGCIASDVNEDQDKLGRKHFELCTSIRSRARVKRYWDEEWGRVGKEGNLWWHGGVEGGKKGSMRLGWEDTMGSWWVGWVFPLPARWDGDGSNKKRRKGQGLEYVPNPRFDEEGRWRPRREWPEELR